MTTEQLFNIMKHDLEKPRATVTMFFEVLDEIIKEPGQLEVWKKNVLKSFDHAHQRIDEIQDQLKELLK